MAGTAAVVTAPAFPTPVMRRNSLPAYASIDEIVAGEGGVPSPSSECTAVATPLAVGACATGTERSAGLPFLADDGAAAKLGVTRCDLATPAGLELAADAVFPEAVEVFDGCASATPGVLANQEPIPRATASAPILPTCAALPMTRTPATRIIRWYEVRALHGPYSTG
ncbi:hypothetical protein MSZK_07710 [Mycobacterium sp. shizuoka-1]|nr:hypothetical protein MSZK_07710 [Mycobacterium sp. shizuoka-1]